MLLAVTIAALLITAATAIHVKIRMLPRGRHTHRSAAAPWPRIARHEMELTIHGDATALQAMPASLRRQLPTVLR